MAIIHIPYTLKTSWYCPQSMFSHQSQLEKIACDYRHLPTTHPSRSVGSRVMSHSGIHATCLLQYKCVKMLRLEQDGKQCLYETLLNAKRVISIAWFSQVLGISIVGKEIPDMIDLEKNFIGKCINLLNLVFKKSNPIIWTLVQKDNLTNTRLYT